MLVQARPDRLRLVRQHDHALAAGALAAAWRGAGGRAGRLPFRAVLATALHDVGWRELDVRPRWNPSTGRPFAFHEHPLEEKLAAYRRGLDRMEEVSPPAGLTGSLHYASFLDGADAEGFLAAEARRRERLAERIRARGGPSDPVARARRDLAWLKLFDTFSIRLCLTPPGVPDGRLPPWLDPGAALEAPDGTALEIRWEDGGTVRVAPWPFGEPVTLELPVRDLPAPAYPDAPALDRAWEEAGAGLWELRLTPG